MAGRHEKTKVSLTGFEEICCSLSFPNLHGGEEIEEDEEEVEDLAYIFQPFAQTFSSIHHRHHHHHTTNHQQVDTSNKMR